MGFRKEVLLGRDVVPCEGQVFFPNVQSEFFIDNLLVRILFISEMIWWTGLAPWEFEFSFPGSL